MKARYIEDFFIHFTAFLAGLRKIVCCMEAFVIWRFVKSRFHYTDTLNVVFPTKI